MTLVLALASALFYGTADFVGGLASRSRSRSALAVTVTSAMVGLIVFSLLALAVPGVASVPAVAWGAASGIAGMSAAACLYASLAIGPMTLVAPLTATISGLTPVIWSISTGRVLDPTTWVGVILVLVGAALISLIPSAKGAGSPRRAAGLAVLAGVLFGAFYVFVAEAPRDSGVIPLIANRGAGLFVLSAVLVGLMVRRRIRPQPRVTGLLPALGVGMLDATANVLYVFAVREGALAVTAVLVSLYPAATIALSAAVLRERIAVAQWAGVVVAFVGIAVLAW